MILRRDEFVGVCKKMPHLTFTNGCFELLHYGHMRMLTDACNFATDGKLFVGINDDSSFRLLKGRQPVVTAHERAALVDALQSVWAVCLFHEESVWNLTQEIKPDILVKGGDYTESTVVGREFAKEVRIVELQEGFSTTKLMTRIREL